MNEHFGTRGCYCEPMPKNLQRKRSRHQIGEESIIGTRADVMISNALPPTIADTTSTSITPARSKTPAFLNQLQASRYTRHAAATMDNVQRAALRGADMNGKSFLENYTIGWIFLTVQYQLWLLPDDEATERPANSTCSIIFITPNPFEPNPTTNANEGFLLEHLRRLNHVACEYGIEILSSSGLSEGLDIPSIPALE